MCEPTTLSAIGMGMAGVQMGVGMFQTNAANKASAKAQIASAEAANKLTTQQYGSMGLKVMTEEDATNAALHGFIEDLDEAEGITLARTAEAGVAGASAAARIQEEQMAVGSALAIGERNTQKAVGAYMMGTQELGQRTTMSKMGGQPGADADVFGPLGDMLKFGAGMIGGGNGTTPDSIATGSTINQLGTARMGVSTTGGYGMTNQGFISMAD